jgi:5-methyltetrahydropteroyltriglutamate--homocysteine methyltransferase
MKNPPPQSSPPFRAEHVGSLLRPAALRRAFRDFHAKNIGADAFRAAQDAAIRDVVSFQQDLGLHGITDGEFRRASYWSHFVDAVEGLSVAESRFQFHDDAGHATPFLSPRVSGKLRRARPISGEEYDFVAAQTRRTPKLTLPSPPTMHFWSPPEAARAAGYRDDDTFFADLAQVYREEIADLARRGARYIQLDEVPLAMLCDEKTRAAVRAEGQDPENLVRRYAELIAQCIAGHPAGMTVGLHLCRGNFKGQWLSEGGYDSVAEKLFNDTGVDVFFLEYDTPRAGDFRPLGSVPKGKKVVLGLVSSKTPALEAKDALKRRIEDASRHVPLDRLAISPQCGFASAVTGNPVTFEDQRAKLKLVRDVANEIWHAD